MKTGGILRVVLLMCLQASSAHSATLSVPAHTVLEDASGSCHASELTIRDHQHPFTGQTGNHGGAGSKYISAYDAVAQVSLTSVSSLTFAIVIALINNEEGEPINRSPEVPLLSALHKVLFQSFISPNAP